MHLYKKIWKNVNCLRSVKSPLQPLTVLLPWMAIKRYNKILTKCVVQPVDLNSLQGVRVMRSFS